MAGLGTTPSSTGTLRRFNTPGDLPASGRFVGELVQIADDGDGKPAIYQWNTGGWVKTADPDSTAVEVVFPTLHNLSLQADGSNLVFDVGSIPRTDSLLVFVGGIALTPGTEEAGGDYTLATRYITFYTAPISGANVLAYYC